METINLVADWLPSNSEKVVDAMPICATIGCRIERDNQVRAARQRYSRMQTAATSYVGAMLLYPCQSL